MEIILKYDQISTEQGVQYSLQQFHKGFFQMQYYFVAMAMEYSHIYSLLVAFAHFSLHKHC